MKNLVHTIATLCLLIWLIGFFKYDLNGPFHFFLLIAAVAALSRFLMEKLIKRKNIDGTHGIETSSKEPRSL